MSVTISTNPSPPRTRPIVRSETRLDGIAIVTIDDPRETFNTITPDFGRDLRAVLSAVNADSNVKAIVLRSGKKDSFVVGANIDYVRAIRFARDAEHAGREAAKRFGDLGRGPKPIVAAVHGPALGGGMELALACSAAVASDDPKTILGLPEVKLGLMPAANGLLRVAERSGYRTAIDLGLTGRNLSARPARALGLLDDVVADSILLETAAELALLLASDPGAQKRLEKGRIPRDPTRLLLEGNPIGRIVLFRRARAEANAKTRGHYPAAQRMLDVLEKHASHGFAAAADLEARLFGELVVSETAHRLIDVFFAQTALKKDTGLAADEKARARPVERVGVVGAGLMGAGIAAVTIQAGLPVRLKDKEDVALGRGLKYVRDALERRRSLSPLEKAAIFTRLSGTVGTTGFRHADVVVEAVLENLALKHAVVRDLEEHVRDTCVIASNTSSIPIAKIAEAARHPERVLGMHYFSPVPKMPLLEVVRTSVTDPAAVATAVALGRRQGKTVIIVRDGAGFYTTRILAPYLNEAAHLLAEGVPVDTIDRAAVDWGFPTGPLQLLDEVGIDIAAHVQDVTAAAYGERMRPPAAFAKLEGDHRLGRKNGRGFYLYTRKRGKRVDDTIYAVLGVTPKRGIAVEEVQLRTSLAMINEAIRCLDEKILASPRDGDIGAIFGLGFPPFRGGPFRYVDVLGAEEVLRRMRSLEQRLGARFEPAPLLVEMARKGRHFYDR